MKDTLRICICICFLLKGLTGSSQIQFSSIDYVVAAEEFQKGSIKGTILTRDGKPAAFVNAQVVELNATVTTNEDGIFEFSNLPAGKYTVEVSFVGQQPQQKNIQVEDGKTTQVNFELQLNAKVLETVIVRATKSLNAVPLSIGKIEIDPKNLPQSIAIISQGLIRDQQALRLSDVMRNVNGVYLSATRAGTQETFSARGYSFSSSNMFKNGTRVNTGAMPEMSSLEKVEVLKGSAAILFGNVAPGGIINMVTKKPKFYNGGEVSMRVGSYDLYKPSFDIYGPISSSVAFRVNGTYEKANSFRDVVHSNRYYVNPSFLINLGKKTELLVQGDYLNHQFTPDFGLGTLDNLTIPNVPRSRFMGAAWQYATTNQATASVSVKHQLNETWKLNFANNYQNYSRDYYSTERIQADANGKWVRPLGRQNVKEDYFITQLDLTGKFSTGTIEHTLLAGVDADRYFTTNYTFNQPATYDTINILDPNKFVQRTDIPDAKKITAVKTPINRVGAYVQDLISISQKLKLLAGIRWSYQQGRPVTTTNLINGEVTKGDIKSDKAFSPRFGLVYRPTATTSLFASYANSFSVNTGSDVYGNAISPSIIDQYEAGIKNDLFKGKLSANFTLYRIINNNLAQTAQFAADGTTVNTNTNIKELTGQTTSDGFEVDLAGHPVKGLDVIGGYSYNYMRYTKNSNATGNFKTGERLVDNPAHTANASIFYSINNSRVKGLKVGATAFYNGERFGGYNNRIGQAQNFSRLISLQGFTTLDLMASYTIKDISLLAKISNLTNTYNYIVHDNYSINPIAPRQVSATVAYKF